MAFCTSVNTVPVTGCLACYRSLVWCEMRSCKAAGITGGQSTMEICSHEKPAVWGEARAWGRGKEKQLEQGKAGVSKSHLRAVRSSWPSGKDVIQGMSFGEQGSNEQCPWLPLLWALCRHTWAVRPGNSQPKLSFPK